MDEHALKPHMTDGEIELFSRHLRTAESIVEFGCGGSTKLAVDLGVSLIHSVESDPAWVKTLSVHPELVPSIASGKLHLHYADVGPVRKWGAPVDNQAAGRWNTYYTSVWKKVAGKPDLVLVDGRWRVACVARAIIECPGSTIVIHDFWPRRNYHVVLGFLDHLDTVDTMGVFRARNDIDWPALCRVSAQYATDIR